MSHKLSLKSFTMAELLVSLTIIGIIAAITMPILKNNINSKTWAAQRKTLYSRLSQAILTLPAVNGYGKYEGTWDNNSVTVTKDTAALSFITQGLAKNLEMNQICDADEISKCGISSSMKDYNGSAKVFPLKLSELQPYAFQIAQGKEAYSSNLNPQKNIDTKVAAFETKNGESVAVFYNPSCLDKKNGIYQTSGWPNGPHLNVIPQICATFIFDLNGRKGPNTANKDIGVMTLFYSVDPELFLVPIMKDLKTSVSYANAKAYCKSKNLRLRSAKEATALYMSNGFFAPGSWTSDLADNGDAFIMTFSGSLIAHTSTNNNKYTSNNAACYEK